MRLKNTNTATAPVTDHPATTLPTLADVSPAWARLHGKLQALIAREDELSTALVALTNEMRKHPEKLTGFPQPEPKPRVIEPSEGARELLGEDAPAPQVVVQFPAADPDKKRAKAMSEELASVREAIATLRPILDKERWRGSIELAKAVRPAYAVIAKQFVDALIALGDAKIASDAFLKEIQRSGATASPLKPLVTDLAGDPRESSSAIRRALSWAAECGWCAPGILPDRWAPEPKLREPVGPREGVAIITRPVNGSAPAGGRGR